MNLNRFHFIYWFLFSVVAVLLDFVTSSARNSSGLDSDFIIRELAVLFIEICTFYCVLFSLVKFDSKNFLTIAKSLFLFILSFGLTTYLNSIRGIIANHYGIIILKSWKELIVDSIEFYVQFGFYSIGYFYAIRFGKTQKELSQSEYNKMMTEKSSKLLSEENIQLQKNLLQSENNFLRAQINPHFLYNCLNFLYSKTFKQQPEVAEGIMMLSQIMRYSLTDFSSTNGLANLEDEIEHIENLIKINEFRFDNMLQIKFYLEGEASRKKIAPMLLMTLVENVFKHGDLQDIAYAATVTCKIDYASKTIQFITSNKKNKAQSESGSGIGLANIKQRLQLLYNDNFKLVAIEEPDVYRVELIMPYFD